ncbi:YbaK/EbsC family protein [Pigmentiphaga aceris]|uniref:YbaK/EbsC family protein n=1 Tax=Pigmentiphaga aceris TaxID=1940612 RepID=A0A5C0B2U0_9BURK|nr:YbaK/EbsC family protein [Pigmentiphaga aceris]QEI08033.1 YbaK/EbsC family protein [Pigmentiphaga aceris]
MENQTQQSDSVQRVAQLLKDMNHDRDIVMLPSTGRTSAEAADSLGCQVAEIAKSIVFRRLSDDAAVMVIASGANRIDEQKVSAIVGDIGKANAKFVRDRIGYAIGGVCPIGHATKSVILLDQDLFAFETVWAAAGHPHAVFPMTPAQLKTMTDAPVVDIAASWTAP